MVICGSHVTDVLPTSDEAENAVMGVASVPSAPGVNVPVPVVAIALPGSYLTSLAGTVSAGDAAPVTKLVDDTVAVQLPDVLARASTTCTLPSSADTTVAPDGTLPKLADAGTEIDSAPLTILNVAVVEPVVAAPAGPAAGSTTPATATTPRKVRNSDLRTSYPPE